MAHPGRPGSPSTTGSAIDVIGNCLITTAVRRWWISAATPSNTWHEESCRRAGNAVGSPLCLACSVPCAVRPSTVLSWKRAGALRLSRWVRSPARAVDRVSATTAPSTAVPCPAARHIRRWPRPGRSAPPRRPSRGPVDRALSTLPHGRTALWPERAGRRHLLCSVRVCRSCSVQRVSVRNPPECSSPRGGRPRRWRCKSPFHGSGCAARCSVREPPGALYRLRPRRAALGKGGEGRDPRGGSGRGFVAVVTPPFRRVDG